MEAATFDFIKGIRHIIAARRLEEWACDDLPTESRLQRLATVYRTCGYEFLGMTAGAIRGDAGLREWAGPARRAGGERPERW